MNWVKKKGIKNKASIVKLIEIGRWVNKRVK